MSKDLTKPTLLRWFCPKCQVEHRDTMPLEEASEAALGLLSEGVPYAVLHDATLWAMFEADMAEATVRAQIECNEEPKRVPLHRRLFDVFRKSP